LKHEDFDRIERYINGEADDSEIKYVETLFLNGEDNFTLRGLLKKDFNAMLTDTSASEVNLSHLLDKVHHKIRKNEILKRQKPLQKFMRIYMRAAAILLLPLLVAGGLFYSYLGNHGKTTIDRQVSSTIYAPLGARVSFNLPDGTTGMLNSGSHLSYSIPFTNNRKVILEGEGWFEVSHDEDHPFEVNTGNSTVKVLGTSFNISAYPAENYVEVVLQQGKVEFQDNKDDEKVTMLPSERLVFHDGKVCKSVTDPAKYNSWTEGKLVFRGDPMAEVSRRIERWYNVKVELADKELEKYSFRATFLDDTLEDVLRCLSMTSPITYSITPRELMQDGTYEKEKVTIYLNK
jgi:ferric-dicitrate binding protein FerR (iron transport regulator)